MLGDVLDGEHMSESTVNSGSFRQLRGSMQVVCSKYLHPLRSVEMPSFFLCWFQRPDFRRPPMAVTHITGTGVPCTCRAATVSLEDSLRSVSVQTSKIT